ncbi:MAG: hypothetical protein ACOY82_18350 [Pseudomonadota bacterium]
MTRHAPARRPRLAAALLLSLAAAPVFAADNPMTFVGQAHNQHLACLQKYGEPGVSPLVTLVRKCGVQPGMPIRDFLDTFRPVVEADPEAPLAERMLPYRDRYTEYEFGFFHRIDEVTVTATNEEQARRMFADLEAEAVANLDINTFSGQSILAGIAVARHSLEFWIRHEPIPEDLSADRKMPRWLRKLIVVAADVGGAMLGASLGAQPWLAGIVSAGASDIADEALPPVTSP